MRIMGKHSRTENNKTVHRQNVKAIIGLLQRNDQVTTGLLAKQSGLSYPTVFEIVHELLEAGIVERQGYADSTGGRQAHLYSICASYAYTFGLHITADRIDLVMINLKGGVVYQHGVDLSWNATELPSCVIEVVTLALNHVRQSKEKLLSACICMSSSLQAALENEKVDLCEEVSSFLGAPVELVSDSAVQGFLDRETLSFSGVSSFLHVMFGDSIRVTLYSNAEKKFELPGSLSHITVVSNGAECFCGKRGCLETYYNGKELLRKYNEARAQRKLPLFTKEEIPGKGLFRYLLSRSMMQDPCAAEALKLATEALASTLSNLITITDEVHVVLSGLYSSNDARNFQMLRAAILNNLPFDKRAKLDLSMGLALPAESALGASRMMNSKYACQLDRHSTKRNGGPSVESVGRNPGAVSFQPPARKTADGYLREEHDSPGI